MNPDMEDHKVQDMPNLELFQVIRVGIKYMPVIFDPGGGAPKALYPRTVWRHRNALRILFATQEAYVKGFLAGMDHAQSLTNTTYKKGVVRHDRTHSERMHGERQERHREKD